MSKKTTKACLVVYDIPTGAKVSSPGHKFRKIGVRINLSCWVVPTHLVPFDYLNELEARGSKTAVVNFDEDEAEKILSLAKEALIKEVNFIQSSFVDSCGRAQRMIAAAGMSAEERQDRQLNSSLARAKRRLGFAQEAALAFDLLGDVQELINGTQKAIGAQFEASFARQTSESKMVVRKQRKNAAAKAKRAAAKAKKAEKEKKEVVTV